MRKMFLLILGLAIITSESSACGPDYSPDREYYNLFMQDIINDSQYYPFLLTLDNAFCYKNGDDRNEKNENIEEWQGYFKLSYDETYYLVFETSKKEIDDLIAGEKVSNDSLRFANKQFVTKYKQALLYLSYAKYLEPYMTISGSDNGWSNGSTADLLDYKKVTTVLKRSWNAESEKELKLRYGYQLVRFAHYNRNYREAIVFFNTYVESLNYRPAMYYHALSQKAGSERGVGDILTSNVDFFKVFSNSKNLKEIAARSIRFNDNIDYSRFLDAAKTNKEKNDAYLLLGYYSFNDPLRSVEKIIMTDPDAIQAKVLIARAVNTIERSVFVLDTYFSYYPDNNGLVNTDEDKRYPLMKQDVEIMQFFERTTDLVADMVQSPKVKDKDFWYITGAYLYFMNKKFDLAKEYLEKVKTSNAIYDIQKKNLAMYIDISEHPVITSELENQFYKKYKYVIEASTDYWDSKEGEIVSYNTQNFVLDVLANRYFLQKDYAKSFLLNNKLSEIENNPQLSLIDDIEQFYRKTNKTDLDKFIAKNMLYDRDKKPIKVLDELNYMRSLIYLTKGDLGQTLVSLKNTSYGKKDSISSNIFGYNRIECFSCDVMATDYLHEFPYIKEYMNMTELTESLMKLKQEGQLNNEKASKANYLFGNFYYNVTATGYYRSLLRFRSWSNYTYSFFKESDIYNGIYFKYYGVYYENPIQIAQTYLEKAYSSAKDNELRARIAFALSKCEQENHYQSYYDSEGKGHMEYVIIKDRKYFKEMMKYKNTRFYDEVKTNCKYFDYYVNNYGV